MAGIGGALACAGACSADTFVVQKCEPSHLDGVECYCPGGTSDGGNLRAPCKPTGGGAAGGSGSAGAGGGDRAAGGTAGTGGKAGGAGTGQHGGGGGMGDNDGMGSAAGATATGGAAGMCTAVTWYLDADQDGYSPQNAILAHDCERPGPEWTSQLPKSEFDCDDGNYDVNPGVTEYRGFPYIDKTGTPSWDWNCNGKVELETTVYGSEARCGTIFPGNTSGCNGVQYATAYLSQQQSPVTEPEKECGQYLRELLCETQVTADGNWCQYYDGRPATKLEQCR
jgi:hypothetical protein